MNEGNRIKPLYSLPAAIKDKARGPYDENNEVESHVGERALRR